MSKKVYAGADIIFDGTTDGYNININTAEDLGRIGHSIKLSNSSNPAEDKNIVSYKNRNSGQGGALPIFITTMDSDISATNPNHILPHESVSVRLWYNDFYIIDSIDAEIPDRLYDILYFNRPNVYEIAKSTMINTDGNKQDVITVSVHAHTVGNITIYPTTIVESNGLNDDTVELNKNAIGHYFLTVQGNISCNLYLKWFGTETPIKEILYHSFNYPRKPVIEKIVRDDTTYIRVTTDAPAHGNIYFNGDAEPTYTYITSRTAPYIAEIEINKSGTYTANIISEVIVENQHYFAYGELSDTLIVENILDAPVAYSDPAFPSQLGFDEVENANIYDVYRVGEDGDDELVATISQNNIVSRVMRKEKMFIVIPNDEVKNV